MSRAFEELERRSTPMGEISLRRRVEPSLQVDVHEAMLGEVHLMSSLFTAAEIALADLALPEASGDALDVVDFIGVAQGVFASCEAREVRFPNHHTGGEAANTIYVAG